MIYKVFLSITFFVIFNISSAFATEIALVSAHYAHPVNNLIEDAGKNLEIGQGMSESVLHTKALIEEENDKLFATFRFNMADQISSFKISTQKIGDESFVSVPFTIMKTTQNSKDLRFEITSKDSIVRVEAFVDAMGRNVIFYGKIGKLVQGSGDFIVSVSEKELQDKNELQNIKSPIVENKTKEGAVADISDEYSKEKEENEIDIKEDTKNNVNENIFYKEDYEEIGVILKGDSRLEKILTNNENTHQSNDKTELGSLTKIAIYSMYNVFATISVLVFIFGILCMISFYSLRKRNDIKEEEFYGFKNKK